MTAVSSIDTPRVVACGPERADEVHRLTQAAFRRHQTLDPPSGAGRESVEDVRSDLESGGGAIVEVAGRASGCLRWNVTADGDLHVRRLAVEPSLQRQGLGRVFMGWAEEEALRRGCNGVGVGVRLALADNVDFYEGLGYEIVGEERHEGYPRPTGVAMRKNIQAP
jgi:GNAT superfamily N-acetyltransferase